MAKRGRKPSGKPKGYFYEEEEQAVRDYLLSDDAKEKNDIFNEKLKMPFTKMIESIIRRYHLYCPDETFDETFQKTFSFLINKFDRFKPDKHNKAYSYYQTIIKNFLMGRLTKRAKALERNPSYDAAMDEFNNNIRYSEDGNNDGDVAKEIISMLVNKIDAMIKTPTDYALTTTEISLGEALINLFENWDFVLSTDGSPKLNKSAILFFLREKTGLDTHDIRKNMKKYKAEFVKIKLDILN